MNEINEKVDLKINKSKQQAIKDWIDSNSQNISF